MPCISGPSFEESQQEKKVYNLNKKATELLCDSIRKAIYNMSIFDEGFPTIEELQWFLEHRKIDRESILNGGQQEQSEIREDIKKAKNLLFLLEKGSQILDCVGQYKGVGFEDLLKEIRNKDPEQGWDSLQLHVFSLLKDGKLDFVKGKLYLNT